MTMKISDIFDKCSYGIAVLISSEDDIFLRCSFGLLKFSCIFPQYIGKTCDTGMIH